MAINENMAMLQIDQKERQRRENFRRAEAFLYWKFGSHINEINRYLFGPRGESLAVYLVEFVEKVEEELLLRTRQIEDLHFKSVQIGIATNVNPFCMRKEDIHGPEPDPSK